MDQVATIYAVPEPATLTALLVGGLSLLRVRRHGSHAQAGRDLLRLLLKRATPSSAPTRKQRGNGGRLHFR